jgi:flagella basal body P-ring formation protein FlgA
MKILIYSTIAFATLYSQFAAADLLARQEPAAVHQAIEQFLQVQTAGLPGQVQIKISAIDPRLNVAQCAALEPFIPTGSRAWGKTTVGVRCSAPGKWVIYVSTTVRVHGDYFVAATPLAQGQSISPKDIAKTSGDLTSLPAGVITDASQAVGRNTTISVPSGAPLRQDALRTQQAIQQGQTVKLISIGPGFRVSAEARALNNATEGQVTQARTQSGQLISGIAKAGGILEVTY